MPSFDLIKQIFTEFKTYRYTSKDQWMELNESKTKSSKTSELTNIVEAFIYSKFLFCFLLELEQNVESVYTLRIPKLSCVCRLNTC